MVSGGGAGSSHDVAVPIPDAVDVEPREEFVTPKKKPRVNLCDEIVEQLQVAAAAEDSTPDKIAARRILTKVSDRDPAIANKLKRMDVKWRRLRKPAGRPRGTVKVTDADIVQALQSLSVPIPELHTGTQSEIRTLELSKRMSAIAVGRLKKTQWCRRLRRCRLGFRDGRCQRGRCDACEAWKHGGRKQLTGILKVMRSQIGLLCPSYFRSWMLGQRRSSIATSSKMRTMWTSLCAEWITSAMLSWIGLTFAHICRRSSDLIL